MTTEPFLVYVIADYGALHDLAFAEVTQMLQAELQGVPAQIRTFAVPAFDTVATGFMLAQTAINSRLGKRHKFFVNTAPRKDDLSIRTNNSGEGFAYAKLANDVEICAVNSGYSLSFVKDAAVELREINCSKEGSQFRSRDVFPPAFGKIVKGDYSQLGGDLRNDIPDIPSHRVCYTDGYGNMKCSIDPSEITSLKEQDVVIDLNGRTQVARVADGIFGVADGQFCMAPGSSGWTLPNGKQVKFTEIIQRGGNAAKTFGKPPGGLEAKWRAA
ncbi:MAG: hypothetical protein GC136_04990 [Alphaproteobacteria bacterium]|nr:hypothetical protein [Alphaproteobacteria bacterium]